jgi:hypothetical protein
MGQGGEEIKRETPTKGGEFTRLKWEGTNNELF